ncbi:MAG: signal recognition particle receptor subunit alpha [DPANN group archaeon]|nr:signal recognition particle receptor subunit alpha [DPANN group archaeon]
MLDKLGESLKDSLRKLLKISLVDKKLVDELTLDIKKSLISGDVNLELATKITESIKKRALEEKPKSGLTHREHVINIVYEELVKLLGAEPGKFEIKEKPTNVQKFEPDYGRFNVVIFDSAGRDALSTELTTEIKKLNQAVKPHEKLLVMSGDIGQAAKAQAKAFKENIGVTGVIITKLDGTAKGGGAISACAETGARVKFIGVGEHIDDFEDYEPKRFVSRLLGLGDLQTLLQKAEEAMKKEDAEALAKKFIKAEFTFDDLMKQMEALQKMGPLSQIMSMIPGASMAKIPPELMQVQEGKIKTWRFIIQSMTKQERDNPDLIDGSRIRRIAKGSGRPESEVRDLVKQYNQMKKMMKMMGNQKQMQKLQKMMGGKLPMGL